MTSPLPNHPPSWHRPSWHPTPLVAFSLALHVLVLPALLWAWWQAWPHWPTLLAALVINHLVLMAQGLWPRSQGLGPTLTRLPAAAVARRQVAITIDDGPDPTVTPHVLDLLARHNARATFFCIGECAQAQPELCRRIVAAGHELGNHGQRHPHSASLMGLRGWHREIEQAQNTLHQITGQRPAFYRAVAGLRNPFLDPVLHRLGLRLAAWTRRGFDTRTRHADTVSQRLLHGLAPGDILLLHDGHAARTPQGEPVILPVLAVLLAAMAREQLHPVTLSDACSPL